VVETIGAAVEEAYPRPPTREEDARPDVARGETPAETRGEPA